MFNSKGDKALAIDDVSEWITCKTDKSVLFSLDPY